MSHGEASIWNPRTILEAQADTKRVEQRFIATEGQNLFILTEFAYAPKTGSLEVHKNGLLLPEGYGFAEQTDTTFATAIPCVQGDEVVATGYVAISGVVEVFETDIYIDNYQAIRDYNGVENTLYCKGAVVSGDGGEGLFRWDAASVDPDDGGVTLLLTGHVGAGRWVRPQVTQVLMSWYNPVVDGATDTLALIDYALAVAKLWRADIIFSSGVYAVSGTVDVVDATGVVLIGQGGGFYSDANEDVLPSTTIKWTGGAAAGDSVVKIRSTQTAVTKVASGGIIGMQIDCNSAGRCGHGLVCTSVSAHYFRDFGVIDSQTVGIYLDCLDNSLNNGAGGPAGNQSNQFDQVYVKTDTGDCIKLHSNAGAAATVGANTNRNHFGQIYVNIRNNDGFVCGNCAVNSIMHLECYRPDVNTGRALVFEGDSTGNNLNAKNNVFFHVQSGIAPIEAEAGTTPSKNNLIFNVSMDAGASDPTVTVNAGASLAYINPFILSGLGGQFVAVGNADDNDKTSTAKAQTALLGTESVRIHSATDEHILFSTSTDDMWEIVVTDGANGGLKINRLTGTGGITLGAGLLLTNQTTNATAPVAGAAAALPATPEGYLELDINGTTYEIPYYTQN